MQNMLKNTWTKLLAKYNTNRNLIDTSFNNILNRYTEPHRYYHTPEHLQTLLLLQERYAAAISDPDTLQFAIFFHDIVYDIKQADNEEKSAVMAITFLQELDYPAARIQQTAAYIRATKDHQPANGNSDLHHFLDFDLAILGAAPAAYKVYTQQIRKEYAVYPDSLYQAGRSRVLQHFLGLPAIYSTTAFREQYEAAARRNLEEELKTLGKA